MLDTTYCTSEFALFHRLERFGDRIADLDAALFEFLGGSPQPGILFDARSELGKESVTFYLHGMPRNARTLARSLAPQPFSSSRNPGTCPRRLEAASRSPEVLCSCAARLLARLRTFGTGILVARHYGGGESGRPLGKGGIAERGLAFVARRNAVRGSI